MVCYYPEHGDLLAAIESADRAQAADTALCATTGCSEGQHYRCCTTPADDVQGTYLTQGYSSDVEHIEIQRTVGNRCTGLWIRGLPHSNTKSTTPHPLELPMGFDFEAASDGDCGSQGQPKRPTIGALGWVRTTSDQFCGFAFDFTLFFQAADGSLEAQRFTSDGVPLMCAD